MKLRHAAAVIGFTLIATRSTLATETDSDVDAMTYVSLDVQGDDADSRDASVSGSVGFAKHYWAQATIGKVSSGDTSSNSLGDLQYFSTGFGARTQHWSFNVSAGRHSAEVDFVQRELGATLEWSNDTFNMGIDYQRRKQIETDEFTGTYNLPLRGPITIRASSENQDTASGVGIHAGANLTDQLNVFAGYMSFNHTQSQNIAVDVDALARDAAFPQLKQRAEARLAARLNNLAASRLTAAVAPLEKTMNVGVGYQFSAVHLSAQYIADTALSTNEKTATTLISAAIFIGDHWLVTPSVGQSRTDNTDNVNFGALSLSYNW